MSAKTAYWVIGIIVVVALVGWFITRPAETTVAPETNVQVEQVSTTTVQQATSTEAASTTKA